MKTKTPYNINCKTAFFITAVIIRIIFFIVDLQYGAIYVDEAMTSLNAFEIAKSGKDIFGDKMPLYFDTWLTGGQSPMATYLSALSVKLLGETKFACRIPVFITNILSLAAFFGFVDEVFEDKKRRIIMYAISAISPWFIFSSALLLDCNYSTFFIMFALYYLSRAINSEKMKNYIFSMVFFGLSFYCYMAVVLIVPILLISVYLILIIKKKISIKNTVISILTVFVVCVPFIALGLVTLGIIPKTRILGFGLENMDYYSRQSSISVMNNSINPLGNFLSAVITLGADVFSFKYEGINKFQFSNLLGGFFIFFAV